MPDTAKPTLTLDILTIDTLFAALLNGSSITVGGGDGEQVLIENNMTKRMLYWYWQHRTVWAGNSKREQAIALVEAAQTQGQNTLIETEEARLGAGRRYTLSRIDAHRFAGVQRFASEKNPPDRFTYLVERKANLFEGRNGSGKTSLLNLLVWCLTGKLFRSQRPPEAMNAGVDILRNLIGGEGEEPSEQFMTMASVTPLPRDWELAGEEHEDLPIDTWVKLTFKDEDGRKYVIKRTLSRGARGKIQERVTGLGALDLDGKAVQVGTLMPGLLPYIRLGSESDMGKAVAELTGLNELVALSKHAGKTQAKISKDLVKGKKREIEGVEERFEEYRQMAIKNLGEFDQLKELDFPSLSIENPKGGLTAAKEKIESALSVLFGDAKSILGMTFDPTSSQSRKEVGIMAAQALGAISPSSLAGLASASRLATLGNLTEEEIGTVRARIQELKRVAAEFLALSQNPEQSSRLRLYALIGKWGHTAHSQDAEFQDCPTCAETLDGKLDPVTKRPVRDHLREAISSEKDYLAQQLIEWATNTRGELINILCDALRGECERKLPPKPVDLIFEALSNELFLADCFRGVLSPIKTIAEKLCREHFSELPKFQEPPSELIPGCAGTQLQETVDRLVRAIAFAEWRICNGTECKLAFKRIIGWKNDGNSEQPNEVAGSPCLTVYLENLRSISESTVPIEDAVSRCLDMENQLNVHDDLQAGLANMKIAAEALPPIIGLGELAERQVDALRQTLHQKTLDWQDKIYRSASKIAPTLKESTVDAKGQLGFQSETQGFATSSEHISNSSAFRANLLGFFLAFWEHYLNHRGGLNLLILDDPHELLDPENREKLANAIPQLLKIGCQPLITTNDSAFAKLTALGFKRLGLGADLDHRSIHAINRLRSCIDLPISADLLEKKRKTFSANEDDDTAALDYANQFRIHVEARLADLFENPATDGLDLHTFSNYLSKVRALAGSPPSDLFESKVFRNFLNDDALKDGSNCIRILNQAHHADAGLVTYMQVDEVKDDLKRILKLVNDIHEEYRRWCKREKLEQMTTVVRLPTGRKLLDKDVECIPDLAAFAVGPSGGEGDEFVEPVPKSWFEGKSLFALKAHNMGFAAKSKSILIVNSDEDFVEDGRWAVVLTGQQIFVRRVLRDPNREDMIFLSSETENPLHRAPPMSFKPHEIKLLKVVGVLFNSQPLSVRPERSNEAVEIEETTILNQVEIGFKVRRDSAVPFALPNQTVLGGEKIMIDDLSRNKEEIIAARLEDGSPVLKRVGNPVPGLEGTILMESVGGLGASAIVRTKPSSSVPSEIPLIVDARRVIGVLYT